VPTAFKARVMRVGNSNVLALPKPLCDGFGIEKGDDLHLIVSDDGIYIPLKPKKAVPALKELQKMR